MILGYQPFHCLGCQHKKASPRKEDISNVFHVVKHVSNGAH